MKLAKRCFFPVLALVALGVAAWFGAAPVRLLFVGETGTARVVGLVMESGTASDLVLPPTYAFTLELADGRIVRGEHDFGAEPQYADGADVPPALRAGVARAAREVTSQGFSVWLRFMQRELRASGPAAVVRLEVEERVVTRPLSAGAALRRVSPGIALPGAGLEGVGAGVTQVTRIRYTVTPATRNERSTLKTLATRAEGAGAPHEVPAQSYLFAQAYTTGFRAVYAFTDRDGGWTGVIPIGRRGRPHPSFLPNAEVVVQRELAAPAIQYARPSREAAPARMLDWLLWFGRVCEAFFSVWAYTLLPLVVALVALAGGVVQLSLWRRRAFVSR